jgi:hypothetical protein
MPASSHPPSATRVKAAFERIHSDLKSFPVESYHKYKYFVSFLNDFSSFAWIVLLWDKASAIIALKQFLAMVRNVKLPRALGARLERGFVVAKFRVLHKVFPVKTAVRPREPECIQWSPLQCT